MEMTEPGKDIEVDRPLTEAERTLIRWMLENGIPEALKFLPQLDGVRVCALCPCGCASIDFKIEGRPDPSGGLHVLGDYLFGEDDTLCGAFVFEKDGTLAGLEVTGYAVDAPSTLPKPSELRPFE